MNHEAELLLVELDSWCISTAKPSDFTLVKSKTKSRQLVEEHSAKKERIDETKTDLSTRLLNCYSRVVIGNISLSFPSTSRYSPQPTAVLCC
ncbi:hypothetical protein NPIL_552571 [Nephila pilipes]|uniref:Uncharacterized protein n=1 Tax=Nephila pilipes TaxID=299642 RepID=A0A8X6Q5C3_NEPPI|nr:hypothetical protein NPIL_552571 [Nephila pilipes]